MTGKLLHKADFDGLEGTMFSIQFDEEQSVDLELVNVKAYDYPGQEVFSLVFFSPESMDLPSQIYNLMHEALGEISLFLVRIIYPSQRDGAFYESSFNRLLDLND